MPDTARSDPLPTIADLQRELAQARAERDEALARETATAEVLGVINASPGDLAPVFDAILEKAHGLCGAAFGALLLYDGENLRAVATNRLPEAFAAIVRQPYRLPPETPVMRVARGETPLAHILDAMEVTALLPAHPVLKASVEINGARTFLAVPLTKENSVLGVITAYRTEVRPFSGKQIALLENFAAQAVIAMENARLLTETREALEQQTATAEVLGIINSSPGDLAPVFEAMLEKALRLCDTVLGVLWTYNGEGYRPAAVFGPTALHEYLRDLGSHPGSDGSGLARHRAGEDKIEVADLAAAYGAYAAGMHPYFQLAGARSAISVALRKDGELLGAIQLYRQEVRPFTDKQIALLQNFSAQAVIAMENARLLTETREALEQQTATAEVLGVINASPGDLAPVFDAIVEKAVSLCGADEGALRTFDGEMFHLAATQGGDPAAVVRLKEMGPIALNRHGGFFGRIWRGEPVVHIADVRETDTYRDSPSTKERLDARGVRTWLVVAMRKDGQLLGVINVHRSQVRPFTDKQVALLQNFAAQAVVAIENARLLGELRERNEEIAGWNKELEARVAAQLAEIERSGKLRRFLAPQLADLIVAQGDDSILESHRREIVVVFCDLRGFTGFAERAEPEEVMALLREYHAAMGPIVAQFEGTIDHYGGDGIMVFFNDPVPTPDPARRAIDMAVAMREKAQGLLRTWRRHGHDLGFGVGVAQGYATLGQIGFAERMDYTAIGTVTNLAARLCGEAKDGQILVSSRVATAIEDSAELEEIGDLSLKGLSQAVAVYNVPY
jgi:class 3 adenylate cyclase/putative methionine-R-sulfoxide reductase with GAF domain